MDNMDHHKDNERRPFKCMRCSNTQYATDELRAAGGFWSKLFDIQNKKFRTVTCTNCGYTELYKRKTGKGENILDFFTN